TKTVNIGCLGRYIRSLRVHVPLNDSYLPTLSSITERGTNYL
ncbi:MAG: hypothetical protein ACI915_003664, partial [Gammaproteobacteria bacterium]